MRTFLLDSVKRQELETVLRQLRERAMTGPLDPDFPPPPQFGNVEQVWEAGKWIGYEHDLKDPLWSARN